MKIKPSMTEQEFCNAIDFSFKFDTVDQYVEATQIGCSISDNAALMVGYEIATQSSGASLEVNLYLLKILSKTRSTPVVLAAIPVIEALLKDEIVLRSDINKLLEECQAHDNAWNGLGILECADKALEEICEKQRQKWQGTANKAL